MSERVNDPDGWLFITSAPTLDVHGGKAAGDLDNAPLQLRAGLEGHLRRAHVAGLFGQAQIEAQPIVLVERRHLEFLRHKFALLVP